MVKFIILFNSSLFVKFVFVGWYVFWCNYYEMIKFRVVMLLLFIVLVGMCLVMFGWVLLSILIVGLGGIGLLVSVVVVINYVVDYKIDSQMVCMFNCFVVKGKVSVNNVLLFLFVFVVVGYVVLELWINCLIVLFILVSLVGYVVVYIMFFKCVML